VSTRTLHKDEIIDEIKMGLHDADGWTLASIFNDLYQFEGPELAEYNFGTTEDFSVKVIEFNSQASP
jgi:hypothetical protein